MTDFLIVLLCFLPLLIYIAMQFWIEPNLYHSFARVTDKDPPEKDISHRGMSTLSEN